MSGVRPHDSRAGFVLAGGLSSRMGRDKARLETDGSILLLRVVAFVEKAAGRATIVAPPSRYSDLDYPVIPDLIPGCGPIGGLYSALSRTHADWNLIVACDMPGVTAKLFESLFEAAESSDADCVVPESATGLDPLCAVYHRRCVSAAESAIRAKKFKMHDFVASLRTLKWTVSEPALLANVNTPEEWNRR